MAKNRHRLSRSIPEDTKREIRRRCGFGCVVCGAALYDYEHFSPEFKDARAHDPNGIALLCPSHHRAKAAGTLTEDAYLEAIRDPAALRSGWSETPLSKAHFSPQLVVGSVIFNLGTSIFEVDGEVVLGFQPPEEPGAPPRLVMRIREPDGRLVFNIEDNHVRVNARAYDVTSQGHRWSVRAEDAYLIDLSLELPFRVRLPHVAIDCGDWGLRAKENEFQVVRNGSVVWSLRGSVFVSGPCLARCDSTGGRVDMSQLTFDGGNRSPPPPESRTVLLPQGQVVFRFPVFFLVTGTRQSPIADCKLAGIVGLPGVLPVFTSRALIERANVDDAYRIESLGPKGFSKMLRQMAAPQGLLRLCLDPDPSATQQTLTTADLGEVVRSLETMDDEDIQTILDNATERGEAGGGA